MSMICQILGLSPAQIAALRAKPTLASDLVLRILMNGMPPEFRERAEAELRAGMEREKGAKEAAERAEARAGLERLGPFEQALSLEKSWHILHYLFTGHADDAPAPGNALLTGDDVGDDVGYGPARLLDEKATQDFARFLQTQDVARLQVRVNYREMADNHVYAMPMGRGTDAEFEAELRQDVGLFFPRLRDYVVTMAGKQNGLLIWLS